MAVEFLRNKFSNIINPNIGDKSSDFSDNKCILYQNQQGIAAYSEYLTDEEAMRITEELHQNGYSIMGGYSIQKARDFINTLSHTTNEERI